MLKKEEGGRHTPFFQGYRPQFYFRTTDVTGNVHAARGHGDGDAGRQREPGGGADHADRLRRRACTSPSARAAAPSALAWSPRSSSKGKRYMTDAEDSHSAQGIRSPAARSVGQRDRRHRSAHRRQGARADPAADADQQVHGAAVPHVDKKSREQFEIRTHKRLLDILEPTQQTLDALMKLDLSAGVDVEIKTVASDEPDGQMASMATLDVLASSWEDGRADRARRRRLRRAGQGAPAVGGGRGPAGGAAAGHGLAPRTRSEVTRQHGEALPAEGHRAGAAWVDPGADLRRRRHRLRSQPAQLRQAAYPRRCAGARCISALSLRDREAEAAGARGPEPG